MPRYRTAIEDAPVPGKRNSDTALAITLQLATRDAQQLGKLSSRDEQIGDLTWQTAMKGDARHIQLNLANATNAGLPWAEVLASAEIGEF
jgi:hypothetical protein